jgi:hypothetical protein
MDSTTIGALKIVGICAGVGGALGGTSALIQGYPVVSSVAGGAVGGAALGALGGLVVGLVSSKNRTEALEVAGLGLGAVIVGRLLGA